MDNGRKTIALLLSALDNSYDESLCRGVNLACQELGYNLVVLPGNYIKRTVTSKDKKPFIYQFNTIYDCVNESNISGIIIAAGSIGAFTDEEGVRSFLDNYKDIPMVLVSSIYSGYTCVNYDNSNGIRDGLEYLVEVCGCKKFGMLKGPSGNSEFNQRYDTFMEMMNKYHITVTEDNICNVHPSDDNHDACKAFLKKNPDIEAVFCINDYSALDLCDEIKALGKTPGHEIKVLGYDNTIQSSKAIPPLATISADPVTLGHEAAAYLDLKMKGSNVDSINLPATLVKRDSLGTNDNAYIGSSSTRHLAEMDTDEAFDYIFYRLRRSGKSKEQLPEYQAFVKLIESLKLFMNMETIDDDAYFMVSRYFGDFVACNATRYADIENLTRYIDQIKVDSVIRMEMESQINFEYIYQDLYKTILQSTDSDIRASEDRNIFTREDIKKFVQITGDIKDGSDENYTKLLSHLEGLHAKNGYVYMLEEPTIHENMERFVPSGNLKLKAFIQDGSIWNIPEDSQSVELSNIFNNDFLGGNHFSMVMLPLYFDKTVYGFILLELTDKIYPNCEFLSFQLSQSTRLINLLK
ncbi:MAG: substrate-binding domain-containing protein [Lachnospiraceae bacterium]|nr:substrate-binding domain-containing protein [Lachnospiraceae bacterium]